MKTENTNRKRYKKSRFGKKISLVAVSFLLVIMTGVSTTISWIEDVSQVEFSTDKDSQQTPLHIGSKILYSDAVMKDKNYEVTNVNLDDYFQKSGDMHLSPCYSNGEDFYFPAEKGSGFRTGTKDDANVNYLSVTFRVRSEGAATAYWFEKTNASTNFVTFKNSVKNAETGEVTTQNMTNTGLEKYLRCSITVDGATNVYAINNPSTTGYDKSYKTVENNAVSTKTGRSVEEFSYYQEQYNSDGSPNTTANSALANQGGGGNLNGNTLFTVNTYDDQNKASTVKTVTVKIWLECGAYNGTAHVTGADLASLNLNIVSGWEKKRRIYVVDKTIDQWDAGLGAYTGANWLTGSGNLFWAIKGDEANRHWGKTGTVGNVKKQYFDIPAVYNNVGTTLYRCSSDWNTGNSHSPVSYWDKYDTTFPNTFHNETFTVYTKTFGTWEPDDQVHCVYFVNSAFFTNVYDYMWDSNSVHGSGINDKVVKNANWPGLEMDTIVRTKTNSQSLNVYAFFYNSDYDRIIFNDGDLVTGANQEYQTQDLWLTNSSGTPLQIVGGTFDMTTLTWFHTNPSASDWTTKIPTYSANNTYINGNFSTNNVWKKTRFAYGGEYGSTTGDAMNGTNAGNMVAKVYVKSAGDFEFVVHYNGVCYKAYDDNLNLYAGNSVTLGKENYYVDGHMNDEHYQYKKNVYAKNLSAKTVYRFYLSNVTANTITISLAAGEAHTTN